MAKIIDLRSSLDQTIKIFDSFYQTSLVVNPDEYDIIHSYFVSVSATVSIADNFTALFFRISQETGIPALELLNQVKGTNSKLEMNQIICYFLNSFKSKTSLYGVGQTPRPNQPVQRNIVQ
jgi:hypothetical protein